MADAAIGHEPLKVRLRKGQHGTVEDAGNPQKQRNRRKFDGGCRKQRHGKTNQAIGACLEKNPSW